MSVLSFNFKNDIVKALNVLIIAFLCMVHTSAAVENPWDCERPWLEGGVQAEIAYQLIILFIILYWLLHVTCYVVYANAPKSGHLQVGNFAPNYEYDNTTLYQSYNDVQEIQSILNPDLFSAPFIAIQDRTLELNAEHGSTAFLTLIYVNSTTYRENDTLDPILFGGGGTAWNLCVWEGCPVHSSTGGSTGRIICAYGQSNAFRTLIPIFDDDGHLVHMEMIWLQSNNLLMAQGLPGDESTVKVFMTLMTKVGELPSDAPVPEPDMD